MKRTRCETTSPPCCNVNPEGAPRRPASTGRSPERDFPVRNTKRRPARPGGSRPGTQSGGQGLSRRTAVPGLGNTGLAARAERVSICYVWKPADEMIVWRDSERHESMMDARRFLLLIRHPDEWYIIIVEGSACRLSKTHFETAKGVQRVCVHIKRGRRHKTVACPLRQGEPGMTERSQRHLILLQSLAGSPSP